MTTFSDYITLRALQFYPSNKQSKHKRMNEEPRTTTEKNKKESQVPKQNSQVRCACSQVMS